MKNLCFKAQMGGRHSATIKCYKTPCFGTPLIFEIICSKTYMQRISISLKQTQRKHSAASWYRI